MILITDKVEFRPKKAPNMTKQDFFFNAKVQIDNEEDKSVTSIYAPKSTVINFVKQKSTLDR